jgi:hypothetical protein
MTFHSHKLFHKNQAGADCQVSGVYDVDEPADRAFGEIRSCNVIFQIKVRRNSFTIAVRPVWIVRGAVKQPRPIGVTLLLWTLFLHLKWI